MFSRLKDNQSGDTIIEVLICLAILVLVLSGAYYTASRSYDNDLDSQEHSEALTIAQSQIEDVRVYGDSLTIPLGSNTCMIESGGVLSSTGSTCYISSSNDSGVYYLPPTPEATCEANAQYCYTVNVTEPSNSLPVSINEGQPPPAQSVSLNTYEVNVSWEPLGVSTNASMDNLTLYYRVDEP